MVFDGRYKMVEVMGFAPILFDLLNPTPMSCAIWAAIRLRSMSGSDLNPRWMRGTATQGSGSPKAMRPIGPWTRSCVKAILT